MTGSAPRRAGTRSAGLHSAALRLLILLLVVPAPRASRAFDPGAQASLSTYVRLPERAAARVRLVVDAFVVSRPDGRVRVEPTRPSLDTHDDAGHSLEWMRTTLEPGPIDTLEVSFAEARIHVAGAWTTVDLTGETIDFALDREVVPGECLVVHLAFDPDAVPADSEAWHPVVRRRHPDRVPLGQRIFVALEGAGTVAVVDRRTGETNEELGVGGRPRDLVYSPVERRLYVAVAQRDELVAVDLGDVDRIRRLPLRFGDDPTRLLLTRDERSVFALARGHDALVQVSASSFQEVARINLEPRPVDLVEDPRTGRIFVSSETSRTVEVVDVQKASVVARFVVSDAPGELEFLADTGQIVVAARNGRSVERIDAGTGASIDAVDLCGPVRGMVYQERAKRLYAALAVCDELTVLRPSLDLEIDRAPLPARPGLLHLDPEGRTVLVPLPGENAVFTVDTTRTGETRRILVGPRPVAVVIP